MPSAIQQQEARVLKPLFVIFSALAFFPFSPQEPAAPTASSAIPAEAAHMSNPVKPTAESQARAKKLYGYDCAMCHGPNGNGKGDIVLEPKVTLKDYTDPSALKDLSDGEIFYIIKNGKGQMPSEGDRAKTDELWNMVILVRSFSKK
jgi:mono/diheme cytochrome c family protein